MTAGASAEHEERGRLQVSESLLWVSRELGITLNDAREALERYAEDPTKREELQRFAELLHAALGALRIAEVQGATLLVEELEIVAQTLHQGKLKPTQEVLDSLLRAAMQLPSYLERLLAGGRDIPLILLPLLNDLRAVRGTPLLSESSLFVINISAAHLPLAQEHAPSGEDATYVSKRLRPHFQSALVGWLRGENVESNLATMSVVADNLYDAARVTHVFQLWWVTGAVIEALMERGLEQSASIKRLVGQTERQLKRLMDEGEQSFENDPPLELLSNLLYYVARARTRGRRVAAVHRAFRLADFLPAEDQIAAAREGLMAPGTGLMRTVAAAIKQDLGAVKDVLDIHVRTGATDTSQLEPQVDHLKKIADTMRVLGLNDLAQEVRDQRSALTNFLENSSARTEAALLAIASAVLAIEDRVDHELLEIVNARDEEAPVRVPMKERDFQHVSQAVMRESKVNLARVKEIVSQYAVKPEDKRDIDALPVLLTGIGAGLLMLEKERALNVIERIGRYVQTGIVNASEPPGTFDLEQLADAIVAVEYYIETLQIGRSDPWYMLDNAETCLIALEESLPAGAAPSVALAPRPAAPVASPVQALEPIAQRVRETIDPELLELFIEEAKEEIASIQEALPGWREAPEQRDHITVLRRSFHTLKGSGRMVGAQLIGELSWAVENLLNRIINRTLPQTPSALELIEAVAAALPQLVEQLEVGTAPQVKVSELIDRASALIDGGRHALMTRASGIAALEQTLVVPSPADADMQAREALEETASDDGVETSTPADIDVERTRVWGEDAAAPSEPAPATVGDEPMLLRIFRDEAATHLDAIRDEIESSVVEPPPHPVSERLFRAWHTLAGSAHTAGVAAVATLAEPLCRYVENAIDHGVVPAALTTMADVAAIIEDVVAGDEVTDEKLASLRARIAALPPVEVEARPEPTIVIERAAPEAPESIAQLAAEDEDASPAAALDIEFPPVAATGLSDLETFAWAHAGSETPDESAAIQTFFLPENEDESAQPEAEVETSWFSTPEEPSVVIAAAASLRDEAPAEWFEPSREPTAEAPEEWFAPAATAAAPETPLEAEVPVVAETPQAMGMEYAADATQARSAALETQAHSTAETAPPAEAEESYDAEIAQIFAEEAGELLEGAEAALGAWRAEPDQREPLHSLQRLLHTLKGGARMAGLARMGTVSHDLETLLTDVANGRTQPGSDLLSLVQHVLDRLGEVRERLTTGRPLGPLQDLIGRIRAFAGGPTAAAETAVSAGESGFQQRSAFEVETAATQEEDAPVTAEPAQATEEIAPVAETTGVDQVAEIEGAPAEPEEATPVEPIVAFEVAAAPPASVEPFIELPVAASAEPVASVPAMPAPPTWAPRVEPQRPAAAAPEPPRERREFARVDAALLENLLNNAGEISIFRARLEQQFSSIDFNLGELATTVSRLREQLRKLELETEAQIRFRHQEEEERHQDFDPLELDRYSTIQQLSRALAESVSDLTSIQELIGDVAQESQGLLVQQSRVTTELQDGLMRTRMVPFSQHSQRLGRIVRQTALELGKLAELRIDGGSGELDRQVLERMLPPFEHMLRNAVVHGVEPLEARRAAGKPDIATIGIQLRREGSQVVIDVTDDGAGLDVATIREKARSLGLIDPTQTLTDSDALQLILQPGFSTASRVTQAAGRGVGMDVVANEVRQLGGSLDVLSQRGVGTRFTIRLPFTLAITQALLVRAGEELYAIPLPSVEGIVRIPSRELRQYLESDAAPFVYSGQGYRFKHLGVLLGTTPAHIGDGGGPPVPVILVRAGEHSSALVTDEMLGSREVVVKSVGPQIAAVRGVSGATILGDGSIAIILDITALVRSGPAVRPVEAAPARATGDQRPLALVVDDSITVRRVTQRLLERHGLRVMTAKDGVDAIAVMQEQVPDVLVLDIEMPRMDGYEVVAYVRNDERLAHVPIVMVTSRVGQKHRAHGLALGVNEYLGKPYQEKDLLAAIERFLAANERGARRG
jgi:chemosensory pili system protein ChpA (sensor histidine kinase/response regulator)